MRQHSHLRKLQHSWFLALLLVLSCTVWFPACICHAGVLDTIVKHPEAWMIDAGCARYEAVSAAPEGHIKLTLEQRILVRCCMARFGTINGDPMQSQPEARARVLFARVSAAEARTTLLPLQKSLKENSRGRMSVGYVLALYKINFEENACAVARCVDLDTGNLDTCEQACEQMSTLYRIQRSAKMMRLFLRAGTDGDLSELKGDVLGKLFMKYPASILRAARARKDMKVLAHYVHYGVDSHKALHTLLRKFERGNDKQLSSLARLFRKLEPDDDDYV